MLRNRVVQWLTLCTLAFSLPAWASPNQILAQVRLRIPFGNSTWQVPVQPARAIAGLQVATVFTPACPIFYASVQVFNTSTGQWQVAPYENGIFKVNNAPISSVTVYLTQNAYQFVECDVSLQQWFGTDPKPTPSLPQGQRTYAGVIDYHGGFVRDQELAFTKPYLSQRVEAKIPAFCKGVELVDVSAPKQDQLFIAKSQVQDPGVWLFSSVFGIDHLRVTLNGPTDASCQIPVYVYDLESAGKSKLCAKSDAAYQNICVLSADSAPAKSPIALGKSGYPLCEPFYYGDIFNCKASLCGKADPQLQNICELSSNSKAANAALSDSETPRGYPSCGAQYFGDVFACNG